MKAYVIKRDDGKYLSKYFNYDYRLKRAQKNSFTDNIYNAQIFTSKTYADCIISKYRLKESCRTIIVLVEVKEQRNGSVC
jgi:hypothetical protein